MNWWAIETWPREEAHVNLKLRRQGFATYFPYSLEWEPSPKSKTLSDLCKRAYFTNYLFVRCERSSLCFVAGTTGVSDIVRAPGDEPVPLPEVVMQKLVDALGPDDKPVSPDKPRFTARKFQGRPGQVFRFGEGSKFFGFYAEIVKVLDSRRLIAQFQHSLFGASNRPIEVPIADVGELLATKETRASKLAHGSPY